ncbi:steroid receptor-associated and regulated protein [Otolemur garnettii]|uniref:Steroid receptor associated and regulated protein n=1 Tax=Otolemur garnettii TaxID=30611 RepID=H0XIV1_OTOGA|nr:steroid receptor-associated and regulated protein [Otolemur garnettii]
MAPSGHPRDWRTSVKDTSLDTGLGTSSAGKLTRHQRAVPMAHLTFVIDCTSGKQLSLAASPPRATSPHRGPVIPPLKTYIVFCGENRPPPTQKTPLGSKDLAQARATLLPCRGIDTPAPSQVRPLCPQEVPEAAERPLKSGRSSTWGTVKDSLRALSSCVCGQAE